MPERELPSYKISVQTAAIGGLVTRDEAKLHLRVEHQADDALIDRLISAITTQLDGKALRKYIRPITLDIGFREWGCERLILPVTPIRSISQITYTDANGDSQTWSSSLYVSDLGSEDREGYVKPAYNETWPVARAFEYPITVRVAAGFTVLTIPEDVKQQALLLIGNLYENRSATSDRPLKPLPLGYEYLQANNSYYGF